MYQFNYKSIPQEPEDQEGRLQSPAPRRIRARQAVLPIVGSLLCAVAMVFFVLSQFTIRFDIEVDGEIVATMMDIHTVEEVVHATQETVEEVLGEPLDLSERIDVRHRIVRIPEAEETDPIEAEQALIATIDEVEEQYEVRVDGEPIGYAAEIQPLREALDERLEELEEDNTIVAAEFLSAVEYDLTLVSTAEAQVLDSEEIVEMVETLSVEMVEHVTETEILPFRYEILWEADKLMGNPEFLREGQDGIVERTFAITFIDGVEISREVVEETVVQEAISGILTEGALTRFPTDSFGEYLWPVDGGRASSHFGPRWGRMHTGLDIAAPVGTTLFAADGGRVVFDGTQGGYGKLIIIQHDNGDLTYYAHNSVHLVSEGDRVYRGQPIARIGMTGRTTGPHVHFEIRRNGVPINPYPLLRRAWELEEEEEVELPSSVCRTELDR